MPLGGYLSEFGGYLSELLEREYVVCRGVARSVACMVNRLVGVQCGLYTFEEKLAEELVQHGDGTERSVVGW